MASSATNGLTRREIVGGFALAMLAAIGFGGWAFDTDRIERLESELASQQERMSARVDSLQEELADADRRRAGLVTRVDKLKLQNQRLSDQLARAREQRAPTEASDEDQASLEAELEATREQHQDQLDALEATVAEVQQVRNRLAKRREALSRVDETLVERRRELERLTTLLRHIDDPLVGGALWLNPPAAPESGGEN